MRRALSGIFALCLLFISIVTISQPVFIKNIPTCGSPDYNYNQCNSQKFFGAGSNLYFFSNDSLWKSNGTAAGTLFVKKIGEAVDFNNIITNGAVFYFTSKESGGNTALWRSDGTAANTVKMVSYPDEIYPLIVYKSELYLAIKDISHGYELWKITGSTLTLVKDIYPGTGGSEPQFAAISNNVLYFRANNGTGNDIWKTDGTAAGTVRAIDMPFDAFGYMTDVNGMMYFINIKTVTLQQNHTYDAYEIWKTNGTFAGTSKVHTFGEDIYLFGLTSLRNKLVFFLNFNNLVDELWTSDGTDSGTKLLKEVGIDGFVVQYLVVNDYLVYYHNDQTYVNNIWKSDGTSAGTEIFASTPSTDPRRIEKVGNLIFYGEHDGPSDYGTADNYQDHYQLIQSDLSVDNTKSVRKIFGSGSYAGANNMTEVNGKLYFTTFNDHYEAPASERVHKLWIYDPFKPVATIPYFTLIDADTDKDLQWLKNGDTITKLKTSNITIRYNPVGAVGSVQFKVNDVVRRTDNVAPYALGGDVNGNYSPWPEASQGAFKISAIPFSLTNATGTAGSPLMVNIYIKETVVKQSPKVSAGDDRDLYLPKDSMVLFGTATDADGKITSSYWQFVSGPKYPGVHYLDTSRTLVSGLSLEGVYTFAFQATDNDGNIGYDEMKVTVKKAPTGLAIISYSMINADSDKEIKLINDGEQLYLGTLPTQNLNIKINLNQTAGKVVIQYDDLASRTESTAPYSFFGDNNGNYNGVKIAPGYHKLTATPYSSAGAAGIPLTIYFNAIQGVPNIPPIADAGPDRSFYSQNAFIVGKKSDPDGNVVSAVWQGITSPQPVYYQSGDTLFFTFYQKIPYAFRFIVTDNKGAVTEDEVRIIYTDGPSNVGISSFVLVNADTDTDIKTIANNSVIDLSTLPTQNVNIKAVPNSSNIGEVVFFLNSKYYPDYISPYTLFGYDSYSTDIVAEKLDPGTYQLKAEAYDGNLIEGNSLTINFTVVNGTTNKLPIVNAGADKPIVLPVNTATLNGSATDSDGTIASYLWTKTTGPAVTMSGTTTTTLQLSGLVEGTYTFRLTATDNKGGQGFDDATVTVMKAGQSVVSFTLINADTDQDIKTISNNETINISQLPTSHLNIRINTNPSVVGSVKFTYDGATRTENGAPYAVFGDNSGNYNVGSIGNGTHTLTATPYSSSNGGGTIGNSMTINFSVVNSAAAKVAASEVSNESKIVAYPNPSTTLFSININEPGEEWLMVEILDSRGNIVQQLFEGNAPQSGLNLIWDGSSYSGGTYICRIISNEKIQYMKLYVAK